MIQISDPRCEHKTGTIQNPRQKLQLIYDPLCLQNPPICSIYRKNPQSVRFLRPNRSTRKPIHPLLYGFIISINGVCSIIFNSLVFRYCSTNNLERYRGKFLFSIAISAREYWRITPPCMVIFLVHYHCYSQGFWYYLAQLKSR